MAVDQLADLDPIARPAADAFDGRPGLPDRFGRALRDLRISVTDRCNFRCPYCMPAEVFGRDFAFLPREEVLSFEEIARLAAIFVGLGVHKLRITGGEPLVRRNLPALIALPGAAADGRRRAGRPHADDQRLGAPGPRAAARRCRAAADHGQPRLARRRGVRADERRRLPGLAGARRDRGRAGRRASSPIKINTVVRRGHERGVDPAARPLGARRGPDPAVHRVHGRRALERLAPRRRRAGRRDPRPRSTPRSRWSRSRRTTAARSRVATGSATATASWASSRRSRGRSAATAPGRGSPRRAPLHLPVRGRRARTSRRRSGPASPTTS